MNINPKNITIVNAHWNNRGDEAALLAFVFELKKVFPKSKIKIAFKDGKSIEQFPKIENVSYFDSKFKTKVADIRLAVSSGGEKGTNETLKKYVKILKDSDLIIYSPGGSVINKRFYWWKQMEYLMPFMCADKFKIPMFIASPSIGPFDLKKPNKTIKQLLKVPEVFCVREDISKEYLKEIGITDNISTTIDLAFLNDIDKELNEKKLKEYKDLTQYLEKYPITVGITITDFQWHVKLNKDEELRRRIHSSFREFIKFLEEKNYGVLFIPQLFGNQNDYNFMNEFSTTNTFIMKDDMDTFFQQYVISKLHSVVGMRYHSNIFAAKMGTPFIAVIYEEKMQGFIEFAKLNDYSVSLDDLSFEKLKFIYDLLEIDHLEIKKILLGNKESWRDKARITIQLMTSLFNNDKKKV